MYIVQWVPDDVAMQGADEGQGGPQRQALVQQEPRRGQGAGQKTKISLKMLNKGRKIRSEISFFLLMLSRIRTQNFENRFTIFTSYCLQSMLFHVRIGKGESGVFPYWVAGRLFLNPQPRECYICYHDSAPQVVVYGIITRGHIVFKARKQVG